MTTTLGEGESVYGRIREELVLALSQRDMLLLAIAGAMRELDRGDAEEAAGSLRAAIEVMGVSREIVESTRRIIR